MIVFLILLLIPLALFIWLFQRSKTPVWKWVIGIIILLYIAFIWWLGDGLVKYG